MTVADTGVWLLRAYVNLLLLVPRLLYVYIRLPLLPPLCVSPIVLLCLLDLTATQSLSPTSSLELNGVEPLRDPRAQSSQLRLQDHHSNHYYYY